MDAAWRGGCDAGKIDSNKLESLREGRRPLLGRHRRERRVATDVVVGNVEIATEETGDINSAHRRALRRNRKLLIETVPRNRPVGVSVHQRNSVGVGGEGITGVVEDVAVADRIPAVVLLDRRQRSDRVDSMKRSLTDRGTELADITTVDRVVVVAVPVGDVG